GAGPRSDLHRGFSWSGYRSRTVPRPGLHDSEVAALDQVGLGSPPASLRLSVLRPMPSAAAASARRPPVWVIAVRSSVWSRRPRARAWMSPAFAASSVRAQSASASLHSAGLAGDPATDDGAARGPSA